MEFLLPCVFTIGPKDDKEYLIRYSKFLINENDENVFFFKNISILSKLFYNKIEIQAYINILYIDIEYY